MVEDFIFLYLEMNLPRAQGNAIPDAIDLSTLDLWAKLCSSIHEGNIEYHPDKVVGFLKQFADPLLAHMEKTMAVLDVTFLRRHIQTEVLKSFEAELEVKNRSDCLPFSAAPLLMLNSDCTHNSWFPPVPSPVVLVLRYIVIPLNSNTWKFSQCDAYMRPRLNHSLPEGTSMTTPNVSLHVTAGLLSLALSYILWILVSEHSSSP